RPFKNPRVLVETCNELKKRNIRARLFVAGDGELLPGLRELSKKLELEDRIHWLGNVADPKSLLQASDIFVLASTGEAFGLVLTEAMACGVPVVGSRSGAIPEIVEDQHTGILAAPRDENSFADALEKLSQDQELRKRFGLNGLERVKKEF